MDKSDFKPHEIYGRMNDDPSSEIRMNKLLERMKKSKIALPKYKVEEKDPSYKMKRGTVMKASSDLHDDKNGKRYITTNMKIYSGLSDKDKASLKKSIMIAIDHKFKGGSISDFPKDVKDVATHVYKALGGSGLIDDFKNSISRTQIAVRKAVDTSKMATDKIKANAATQGKGFRNVLIPKGMRKMIYFDSDTDSDTSSSDDDPLYLPIKRGRGRPRKCQ